MASNSSAPNPAQAFIPALHRHTRRKTSVPHARRRASSLSSSNILDLATSSAQITSGDADISMDANIPNLDAWKAAHHLRDVASKVGTEVERFAEHLDAWRRKKSTRNKDTQVAELVGQFRSIAKDAVDNIDPDATDARIERQLRRWRQKIDPTTLDLEQDSRDKHDPDATDAFAGLEAQLGEYNTWLLFEKMLVTRYAPDATPDRLPKYSEDDRFASDGQAWFDFLASDSTALEQHVIVKWLQGVAERDELELEAVETELDHASQRGKALSSQGWLDTRETLKSSKRQRTWDVDEGSPNVTNQQGEGLVFHMDSDAPTRLQKKIEFPDETFETSFWHVCWELFRRGSPMSLVQSRCEECNELIRAVVVGAISYTGSAASGTLASPSARYRWRSAARSAAHRNYSSEYERAVLGFLSGDLTSVEPICESWEDYCLAHCNAQLLSRYMRHIGSKYAADLPPPQLYKFTNQDDHVADLSMTGLMDSVRAYPLLQGLPRSEYSVIQQNIITGELIGLLVDSGSALGRREIEVSRRSLPVQAPHGIDGSRHDDAVAVGTASSLRLLAHIYIILRELGVQFPSKPHQEVAENVLIAYMDVLLLADRYSLLPTYATHLSPLRATHTLADTLSNIKESNERRQFVRLMDLNGFDVAVVLDTHFRDSALSFRRYTESLTPFGRLELLEPSREPKWPGVRVRQLSGPAPSWAESEAILIESLEWFSYIQGHWFQTFGALTDAAMVFLACGRCNAALDLVRRNEPRQISRTKTNSVLGKAEDLLDVHQQEQDEAPGDVQSEPYQTQTERRHAGAETGESQARLRTAMKVKATIYHEIAQLCEAIFNVWEFRHVANTYQGKDKHREPRNDDNKELKTALDDVKATMEPLLQPRFLTTVSSSALMEREEVAKGVRFIREAYLPELVLAYASVFVFTARALPPREGREAAVDGVELAKAISGNRELCRCFQHQGRLRELMDILATCSKTLLKLNEEVPPPKQGKSKKRSKGPNKHAVWDVTA